MQRRRGRIIAELAVLALVLACLAGALGSVMAMHRRQAIARIEAADRSRTPAPVAPPSPAPIIVAAPEPEPEPELAPDPIPTGPTIDPTPTILAKVDALRAEQAQEASVLDRRSADSLAAKAKAEQEADDWQRREAMARAEINAAISRAADAEAEADAIALERDALAQDRDAAKAAVSSAKVTSSHAVMPNKAANGTWRAPIVLECHNGMVTLRPGGQSFSLMELSAFGPRSHPLVAAVAREAARLQGESPDGAETVPYLFFLVRPDGVRPYYEARGRLENLGIAFGYELVDEGWTIDTPDLSQPAEWGLKPRLARPLHPETPLAAAPAPAPAPAAVGSVNRDTTGIGDLPAPVRRVGGSAGRPPASFGRPVAGTVPGVPNGAGPGGTGISPVARAGSEDPGGIGSGVGHLVGSNGHAAGGAGAGVIGAGTGGKGPEAGGLANGNSGGPGANGSGSLTGPIGSGTGTGTAAGGTGGQGPGTPTVGTLAGVGTGTLAGADGSGNGSNPEGANDAARGNGPAGTLASGNASPGGGTPSANNDPSRNGASGTGNGENSSLAASGSAGAGKGATAGDAAKGPAASKFVWGGAGGAGGHGGRGPKGTANVADSGAFEGEEGQGPAGGRPGISDLDELTAGEGTDLPRGGKPAAQEGPLADAVGRALRGPLLGAGEGSDTRKPIEGGSADPLEQPDRSRVAFNGFAPNGRGTYPEPEQGQPGNVPATARPAELHPDLGQGRLGPKSGSYFAGMDDLPRTSGSSASEGSASETSDRADANATPGDPSNGGNPGSSGSGGKGSASSKPKGKLGNATGAGGGVNVGGKASSGQPGGGASIGGGGSPGAASQSAGAGIGMPSMNVGGGQPGGIPQAAVEGMDQGSPDLPEESLELVVACGPGGVVIQPGGYRLSNDAMARTPDSLRSFLVSIAAERQRANMGVLLRPGVRFLIEVGGQSTYAKARQQTILSDLDWPISLQVAEGNSGVLRSRRLFE
ncbi:hypothetical protein EP7_004974 [Isosphaeraceae bacterium EP7]